MFIKILVSVLAVIAIAMIFSTGARIAELWSHIGELPPIARLPALALMNPDIECGLPSVLDKLQTVPDGLD